MEDIWEGDLFNRKAEADFIERFTLNKFKSAAAAKRPFSFVLNVDADWGQGKTFMLDRFGKQFAAQGHIVPKVDAWAGDFGSDPLLPVITAIETALKPHMGKKGAMALWKTARDALGPVIVAGTGGLIRGVVDRALPGLAAGIQEALGGENQSVEIGKEALDAAADKAIDTLLGGFAVKAIDEYRQTADAIDRFRANMERLLSNAAEQDVPMPMFVTIDELDRCRPSYAVAMLERVKHLFQVPGVVFVFASNTDQLSYAVNAVYGAGFDSGRYLHRFFDLTYRLTKPTMHDFVRMQMQEFPGLAQHRLGLPNISTAKLLAETFTFFDLSARDAAQCIFTLDTVLSSWQSHNNQQETPFLAVLIPLVCGHQRRLGGETLAECVDRYRHLRSRGTWKHDAFRTRDGMVKIDPLTILETSVQMVELGYRHLNSTDQTDPLREWVVSRMFESGTDGAQRRFGIEAYPARIRTAGRIARSISE